MDVLHRSICIKIKASYCISIMVNFTSLVGWTFYRKMQKDVKRFDVQKLDTFCKHCTYTTSLQDRSSRCSQCSKMNRRPSAWHPPVYNRYCWIQSFSDIFPLSNDRHDSLKPRKVNNPWERSRRKKWQNSQIVYVELVR